MSLMVLSPSMLMGHEDPRLASTVSSNLFVSNLCSSQPYYGISFLSLYLGLVPFDLWIYDSDLGIQISHIRYEIIIE